MQMIFGNSLATGKHTKGSNEQLGIGVNQIDQEEESNEQPSIGGDSSATRPTKRAKSTAVEEDTLVATLGRVGDKLADAIIIAGERSAPPPPPPPPPPP